MAHMQSYRFLVSLLGKSFGLVSFIVLNLVILNLVLGLA
jgi:hypothetical protein